jgi:hypothetical protein
LPGARPGCGTRAFRPAPGLPHHQRHPGRWQRTRYPHRAQLSRRGPGVPARRRPLRDERQKCRLINRRIPHQHNAIRIKETFLSICDRALHTPYAAPAGCLAYLGDDRYARLHQRLQMAQQQRGQHLPHEAQSAPSTEDGSAACAPRLRSAERTEPLPISGSRRHIPQDLLASVRKNYERYERSARHFQERAWTYTCTTPLPAGPHTPLGEFRGELDPPIFPPGRSQWPSISVRRVTPRRQYPGRASESSRKTSHVEKDRLLR